MPKTQPALKGTGSVSPVGSGEHVVEAGECAISIADASGHFWKTVWEHPANAALKQARGSPHVLLAGDRLHVPEIRRKESSGATEARHRFRRKGIPISFEIQVQENGRALAGWDFCLVIEGRVTSGKVPDDGVIKAPMKPQDQTGELRVQSGARKRVYPLSFGHLDPVNTPAGAHARLRNLGYIGSADDAELFQIALKRFQKDNQIDATGELDDATASKLVEVHGS